MKLLIFGSGRGSNFRAIYQNIQNGRLSASVVSVVSDVENSGIIQFAKDQNITTLCIPKGILSRHDHEQLILTNILNLSFDLVILAGYMRILSEKFIHSLSKPIINIHPSLLPAFKGLHAQQQALDFGVKYTGCTVHIVTPDVDSGRILGQKVVEVKVDDTVAILSSRILEQEHILFSEILMKIENHEIVL